MLAEVYNALRILYGQPPKTFDFEYTDTDKVYHCDRGLTPKQFLDKYVGSDFDDYAVIIASPIHAVNRTYCQPFMGMWSRTACSGSTSRRRSWKT